MSDFAYGLAGFMDAYQRARGGGRGQSKQPDPYVEQERYNKLKRETDDKSADQAYEAIKSLASGGKDPSAIAPPPQMPLREPGNTGFGMQRPGSLGGPGAGGGYGGGPLFGGGMGGGQPLDMNMGPIGIPLGILSGLGQAMGGGKQGAPSGPPQGFAAAAPPSPATAATPPAASAPPSGAAGGPSPLSPTYAGEHPMEMFQPAGSQDQPDQGSNTAPMAAAPSADGESFSISPPPTLKSPDLSRMKEIDQQLAAAGYDEHARNQAKMRFAEEAQKQSEKDYDMAHKQWAADVEYKTKQHEWNNQAAAKAKAAIVESRNAEKANMEMQELGMKIVKTKIETQRLLAENGGIPDERTAKLQAEAQRYREQIAESKKAYDQAQTRIGAMMAHANALQDDHMKEIAEQQVQAGLKEQESAQARINMGQRHLKDVNQQLGTDEEPRPEDMPPPRQKPAAPKEEPSWYQRGGALGKLGNYLYGPDTQGMAAAPDVVYDPQGRAMRYKGGPKNDPSSYEPAQ